MVDKSVLITGATGAVGPSVVRRLVREGYRVAVLARRTPDPGLFPEEVQVVLGEVNNRAAVAEAVSRCRVVVHMASMLHLNHPNEQQEAEIRRVNVEGTRTMVQEALGAGVERFVYVSTIAVYGYSRPEVLAEESELFPTTIYGETKREGELIALGASRPDGTPLSTVLRLSAVYGPRIKGNYSTLLRVLSRGRFVPLGPGDNHRTLIHVEDVAAAIALASGNSDVAGEVFNVTDGETHQLSRIIEEMAVALGRESPRLHLPLGATRLAAHALDGVAKSFGRRSKVAALVDKYLEEVKVDGSKLTRFGFRPKYDLKDGWAQTVGEMRAAGDL